MPDTLLKKDKEGNLLRDAGGSPLINPAKFKSAARKASACIRKTQRPLLPRERASRAVVKTGKDDLSLLQSER